MKEENPSKSLATSVVQTLRAQGFTALFAGGCVRDLILNRSPKDFDVATNATPQQIAELFPKTYQVGAAFGVVIVVENDAQIEVATFRSDGVYSDGRRPDEIVFTTPEADAKRRDFTINGLFLDPVSGEIVDYVGGKEDIKGGLVRAIGVAEHRFTEDKLRLMRCVRFASVLGFTIEEQTWKACRALAGTIGVISPERIREELTKILVGPNGGKGLELLYQSGLLHHVLPEVLPLIGCEQQPEFHPEGDVWTHTKIMLDSLDKPSPELAWSVLFHDIAKPDTFSRDTDTGRIRNSGHEKVGAEKAEEIMRRLRFSNKMIESVSDCVLHHMQFKDVKKMKTSTLKRMIVRETFGTEMELHRIDCMSSHRKLGNYEFMREKEKEFSVEEIRPVPLITGHDLMSAGWPPGPALGKVLEEIAELQLDGQVKTREEALAYAKSQL
ncbi:MAG: CCA tRNA nucleotidyltransferase [Verrucomicrobiota bacterium]|nr:CCA tRNA nucleotidyltransferase [Verrucomicrobiota bacterium]